MTQAVDRFGITLQATEQRQKTHAEVQTKAATETLQAARAALGASQNALQASQAQIRSSPALDRPGGPQRAPSGFLAGVLRRPVQRMARGTRGRIRQRHLEQRRCELGQHPERTAGLRPRSPRKPEQARRLLRSRVEGREAQGRPYLFPVPREGARWPPQRLAHPLNLACLPRLPEPVLGGTGLASHSLASSRLLAASPGLSPGLEERVFPRKKERDKG